MIMKRSSYTLSVEARPSPLPRPSPLAPRPPSAFTLVELLVVVVIISMLAALLLPAVMSARERARVAQCGNNQHQLFVALQQYDAAKQHLPGYVNRQGANTPFAVTWIPVLFPFLGRMDLWEGNQTVVPVIPGWRQPGLNANGTFAAPVPQFKELVCPDDTPASTAGLSYVLNVGLYDLVINPANVYTGTFIPTPAAFPPLAPWIPPASPTTVTEYGPFRDTLPNLVLSGGSPAAPRPVSLSSVTSPAVTPMISECTYAFDQGSQPADFTSNRDKYMRTWSSWAPYNTNTTPPSTWTVTDSVLSTSFLYHGGSGAVGAVSARYGFVWPDLRTVQTPAYNTITVGSSFMPPAWVFDPTLSPQPADTQHLMHAGIVVVTFCDGHTDSLSDNALCSAYSCAPIP